MNRSVRHVSYGTDAPVTPAQTQAPDCKCPECFGLAEYMLGLTGKDYGLARKAPVQHAPEPTLKHRGDCICDRCRQPRRARKARPPVRQPWEPRPARHRKAA